MVVNLGEIATGRGDFVIYREDNGDPAGGSVAAATT